MNKNMTFFVLFLLFLFGVNDLAFASGGIPELASPLEKILATLQGPLAKVFLVFMLIIAGFGFWNNSGENTGGFLKVLLGVVLMMTTIALATSIVATLFPSVSGALI